ncbi:hypothetical protein DFH06DRAFT_1137095 [Mycena polygramma]|nr:hypothetical protein DFH06DRAFT_1137095 [Mycena polygramma]
MAQSAEKIAESTHSPNTLHPTPHASQDAYALIGSHTLGEDYELCLVPSESSGNKFVYKARQNYQPLRAAVLGVVLNDIPAVTEENEAGGRLILARLARASDNTATFFYNDVWTLARTMDSEDAEGAVTAKAWCYEDPEQDGGSVIYVDYNGCTACVNGQFGAGSNVVVEATFHRRDVYVGEERHRFYTILAHEIEVIATSHLELAGLVHTEGDLEES